MVIVMVAVLVVVLAVEHVDARKNFSECYIHYARLLVQIMALVAQAVSY